MVAHTCNPNILLSGIGDPLRESDFLLVKRIDSASGGDISSPPSLRVSPIGLDNPLAKRLPLRKARSPYTMLKR